MGIRYYAYAFGAELTEHALAAPEVFISRDPLGDARGLPHGWFTGEMQGQLLSHRVMLYLDKAWPLLQRATGSRMLGDSNRPAFRMFEGQPHFNDDGSHDAWVRALSPADVVEIAQDLESIPDAEIAHALECPEWGAPVGADDLAYATDYFHAARDFAGMVATDGRGFVYAIC